MPIAMPVVEITCAENVVSNAQVKAAKSGASKAKKTPENAKIEAVSKPSEANAEAVFGLKRLSFLLPNELAEAFEERGGAAWLAMILRGGETVEATPKAAVMPNDVKPVSALPAKAFADICEMRGVDDPTLEPTYNRRRAYRD